MRRHRPRTARVPGDTALEALRAEHLALEREGRELARAHAQLHERQPHDVQAHVDHRQRLLAHRRKLSAHLAKLKEIKAG